MQSYVEVAINLPQISDTYHYHLPEDLAGSVLPGSLVIVPFGKQRVQGVVLHFVETPEVAKTKPIQDLVDEKPVLTASQMALAHWLADETLAPLGVCINLMLPPGLSQYTDTLVRLNPDRKLDPEELSPVEKRIVNLLKKRDDLRARQIDAAIRHVEWRGVLRKLARKGIVHTQSILPPPRVSPKTVRKVILTIPLETVDDLEEQLSRVHRVHDRRMRILRLLAEKSEPVEPSGVYAQVGAKYNDLKALEEKGLINQLDIQVWRDPLEDTTFVPASAPELTRDQKQAWEKISAGLSEVQQGRAPRPFLLHGVTGSGKTELYLKAVRATLDSGKKAVVLVPEISLTPQTVKRFLSRFPGQVGVVHSQLSEGERYDTWRRVRNGELSVIIGPRSALFMPLENLGLIVVDECHHESYDQQDSPPYYHAASTAVAAARFAGAAVILGSATPRVTQFYKTISGDWTHIGLPHRILAHRETIAHYAQQLGFDLPIKTGEGQAADLGLPKVSIVDMRQELQSGNRSAGNCKPPSSMSWTLISKRSCFSTGGGQPPTFFVGTADTWSNAPGMTSLSHIIEGRTSWYAIPAVTGAKCQRDAPNAAADRSASLEPVQRKSNNWCRSGSLKPGHCVGMPKRPAKRVLTTASSHSSPISKRIS